MPQLIGGVTLRCWCGPAASVATGAVSASRSGPDEVRVVDTKSEGRAELHGPDEWAAFVAGVKAGEFDLP